MRFLNDGEIKNLPDEATLDTALKFYEEHDKWFFPYAKEIEVKGVENAPLFYGDYMAEISATTPEQAFEENVRESGLFFKIPNDEKMRFETYAIRDIGLEAAYERAGLACRLIRTLKKTGYVRPLGPVQRGEILTTGFKQSDEQVKVLVSDEKISNIGSCQYAILPYRENLEKTKNALFGQPEFESLEYSSGSISHEGLVVRYLLNGTGPDSHRLMCEDLGIGKSKEVEYYFIFSSSNARASSMIGRLAMNVDGAMIPIGKAVKVRHLGEADTLMETFERGIYNLGVSMKENEDLIEELGNTTIYHPQECLKRVFETCPSIPSSYRKKEIEDMGYRTICTGMDIYLSVAQAAANAEGPRALVQAMEEAANVQYLNFARYDKEA